jgi:hypothetical protein
MTHSPHWVALSAFAIAAAGCAPATLQAPYTPNPVLLGPVDRVGGHRTASEATLTRFEIEGDGPTTTSKETRLVGGELQVTRRIVGSQGAERAVTNAVVGMTEGRSERDVRVDEIPAGSYVWVYWSGVIPILHVDRWVDVSGHVSEVRRGR